MAASLLTMALLQFIVGSSIVSTFVPFLYIGIANMKYRGIRDYENVPFFIPIMFGGFTVATYFITRFVKREIMYLAMGGILGIVFSLVGKYNYDAPVKMFGFNRKNEHLVHLYAFAICGGIFYFIVRPLSLMM